MGFNCEKRADRGGRDLSLYRLVCHDVDFHARRQPLTGRHRKMTVLAVEFQYHYPPLYVDAEPEW